jgi:glycosyltransferase involved in cell wall biosynthesis
MKVSAVISTYNQARYLKQAVDSVLEQKTDFAYEIVIVDDASTDGSQKILSDYRAAHPDRVRLVLHPTNLGWAFSTFDLVKLGHGKYVALLEGDDYWIDRDKLQKQADFLDSHAGFSLCAHANVVENEIDNSSAVRHGGAGRVLQLQDLLPGNMFHTGSLMFRNDALAQWPEAFAGLFFEDWSLQVLLAQKGDVMLLPDVMSVYRVHKDGLWSSTYRGTPETEGVNAQGWKLIIDFWSRLSGYLPTEYEPVLKELIAKAQRYVQLGNIKPGET